MSHDPVPSSPGFQPQAAHPDSPPPSPQHPRWRAVGRKLRWILLRGVALLGGLALLVVVMTGAAGWYTSRPQFCASCHIMEPYYKSWETSTHKDVSCIECHFPPGVGGKVRGKLLGLVQLAKYVTSSAGSRPAAEIPDASCLRSGCHETRLLSGRVDFHVGDITIPFDHKPHMEQVRRGKELRCTSCHSQIVQGKHMTVTPSTCFLCHFKGEHFNEGLGRCTHCHQIPEQKFDLGGGVTFTHELAFERGVDCANCHGDLIRGNGDVPQERCVVCHNRPDDLKRINDHEFIHHTHVTEHHIDCLNCHMEIQHSLDRNKIEHARSDCASCHPNHHQEQVDMLRGVGAKTIASQSGGMLPVRVECKTCHRFQERSSTGTVLWRASAESCATCHDHSAIPLLKAYQAELKAAMKQIEEGARRAREAAKSASLPESQAGEIAGQLESVQHDLDFLHVANGIHNIHYAASLTTALADRVTALCRKLKIPEPKITLPKKVDGLNGKFTGGSGGSAFGAPAAP
ncbi:MAG: NapC/NirT family cytochrome c [Thermoguttaceae bacterium]